MDVRKSGLMTEITVKNVSIGFLTDSTINRRECDAVWQYYTLFLL